MRDFSIFWNGKGSRIASWAGKAVNAYVEPLISLDVDFVIAPSDLRRAIEVLQREYTIREFPNTINIQSDPRYADFVQRAERRNVMGRPTMVAAIGDLLRGKIWAASDPQRRPSKQLKDWTDIARILEKYPELRRDVPEEILSRIP